MSNYLNRICPVCGGYVRMFTFGNICESCGYHLSENNSENINKDTSDMVEVVRCQDCKHFNGSVCFVHSDVYGDHDVEMLPSDYCSYGKRKKIKKRNGDNNHA